MRKGSLYILIWLFITSFAFAQTTGTWTYRTSSDSPVVYTFSTNGSWSLTWTYYYINWYLVNGVQVYTYPGDNVNFTKIGLDYNYGVWNGVWNWTCEECDASGQTPCIFNPCGGAQTGIYPGRYIECNEYTHYMFVDRNASNLVVPTFVTDTNQVIHYLPAGIQKLYSPGGYWDYPNKPYGNGDGPVIVSHSH